MITFEYGKIFEELEWYVLEHEPFLKNNIQPLWIIWVVTHIHKIAFSRPHLFFFLPIVEIMPVPTYIHTHVVFSSVFSSQNMHIFMTHYYCAVVHCIRISSLWYARYVSTRDARAQNREKCCPLLFALLFHLTIPPENAMQSICM